MAEENLVPSSDHPIRIRWLNAAGKRLPYDIPRSHFRLSPFPRTKSDDSTTDRTACFDAHDKNKQTHRTIGR